MKSGDFECQRALLVGRGHCSQQSPQGHSGGCGLDWSSNTGNCQATAISTSVWRFGNYDMGFQGFLYILYINSVPLSILGRCNSCMGCHHFCKQFITCLLTVLKWFSVQNLSFEYQTFIRSTLQRWIKRIISLIPLVISNHADSASSETSSTTPIKWSWLEFDLWCSAWKMEFE